MMQQFNMNIPEPCHENWNNMTATEQGRFCSSCKKEVVDFSRLPDHEVYNILKRSFENNHSVCGRVLQTQLERPIFLSAQKIKSRIAWYWKYVTAVFLFSSQGQTVAQTKRAICVPLKTVKKPSHIVVGEIIDYPSSQTLIKTEPVQGKVVNDKGEPVPFASVKIKGSKTGNTANESGNYTIKAIENELLEISAQGVKTTVSVGKNGTVPVAVLMIPVFQNSNPEYIKLFLGDLSIRAGESKQPTPRIIVKVKDRSNGKIIKNAAIGIRPCENPDQKNPINHFPGFRKLKKLFVPYKMEVTVKAAGFKQQKLMVTAEGLLHTKKRITVTLESLPATDKEQELVEAISKMKYSPYIEPVNKTGRSTFVFQKPPAAIREPENI